MAVTITSFSGGVAAVAPSNSLVDNANFLYALCGKFAPVGQNQNATGGTIAPVNTIAGNDLYPFIITSADFEADGISYVNTAIVGDTLSLFANQYSQQWLLSGVDTFSYTANGFVINIPGFDALTQDWTIMVQKISSQ